MSKTPKEYQDKEFSTLRSSLEICLQEEKSRRKYLKNGSTAAAFCDKRIKEAEIALNSSEDQSALLKVIKQCLDNELRRRSDKRYTSPAPPFDDKAVKQAQLAIIQSEGQT